MSSAQLAKMMMGSVRTWMKCSVQICTNEVLVDENVVSVKCSICTLEMAPLPKHLLLQKKAKSEKPAGWRFMKLFVDKDGNVYHTGVEQLKLKGTLKPSDVDKIREDQKKKREETKKRKKLREKLRQERLVKQHKKSKVAKKKAQDKKDGKVTKRKVTKKKTAKKRKVTKGNVKYEKFEEPRIATDRNQIQKFLESESIFAEKLATRQIEIESIVKIARSSYAAIDKETGVVKNKRRGYKITLENGNTNIINISIK